MTLYVSNGIKGIPGIPENKPHVFEADELIFGESTQIEWAFKDTFCKSERQSFFSQARSHLKGLLMKVYQKVSENLH